ncbi:helix-turn-helix domain-containing protein [Pseudomaricurvus alkylphenolicus]|uniref:YdaS family helix-turn-helix protein n=1 Tax=Pseudomaricurvus alkylphenolicus TaxID=1306991 RepID=UPI00141E00D7|nr:YdaS family helix-turn-helix protein [Pseudomaricurvus alkylphenolicus]NIB44837.1 helix-turn-helix domain-containing protein [Pseudomaricurvus alkylphenolicus]
MSKDALLTAIDRAGGQTALTKKINQSICELEAQGFYFSESAPRPIKQANIWAWLQVVKGPVPPAEYVIPIELAVGVSRHSLRSDVYGSSQTAA